MLVWKVGICDAVTLSIPWLATSLFFARYKNSDVTTNCRINLLLNGNWVKMTHQIEWNHNTRSENVSECNMHQSFAGEHAVPGEC